MHSRDGCTACCKILKIRELNKPANTWCKHCNIGVGCGIYDSRPESIQRIALAAHFRSESEVHGEIGSSPLRLKYQQLSV